MARREMSERGGVLIEEFIQALTSQLDRAQATMAVKARNLPLTFAVREISVDLRAHVEVSAGAVRIHPAGPRDVEASIFHIALTTITRPMIEENTFNLAAEPDEPSLKDLLGDEMSEEEQRRLEWAGIHTASQLRQFEKEGGETMIERVSQIPAMRLRQALERASQPFISRVLPGHLTDDPRPMLRVRGQNLMQEELPSVRIGGEQATVVQANEHEILIAPLAHQMGGLLEVEPLPGAVAQTEFQIPASKNGGKP